jgi:formylglycine-generating enzyme required for sulfatase activity
MADHAKIERDTGLVRLPSQTADRLPVFMHESTRQQFVLIPGGSFLMGMTARELTAALREIAYDPDIESWRASHRAAYATATPVHAVTVQPFLCGRSPLLGRTIDESGTGVSWSVPETVEHHDLSSAAELRADAAIQVLTHYGWDLINEAQWEYVARRAGRDEWAGGTHWRKAVDVLVDDDRCTDKFPHASRWGIWGFGLGEWVADQWHDNYVGAPVDGSAWRDQTGAPGAMRGGGVLHAPWQDSDEAISCHVALRPGDGAWRGVVRARPVIALPGLHAEFPTATEPAPIDFDTAVAELEHELRAAKAREREEIRERSQRIAEAKRSLRDGPQEGTIRSVGEDGVYVVRLAAANGILRLAGAESPLRVGDKVTVRVVGSGGVPELALVSRDS